ncbi:MAG: hypothetical protein V4751_04050 [Pseudomonadota bacterium]
MTISSERFTAIVEAYGAQPARWPTEERTQALAYCAAHPEAQAMLEEFQMLDDMLDQFSVADMSSLQRNVLNQVARTSAGNAFDLLLDWLVPHSERLMGWLWRPALVACLPLVCGILLADYFSFGIDGVQNSREEELYLLSLNDYTETFE